MNTAFTELRTVKVSITKACALTGRSRATPYRHADPAGLGLDRATVLGGRAECHP